MTGVHKVLDALGLDGDAVTRGQPRHHRRHQQAARGQGREPRVHHHRGLRVPPGDRPAVRARRLRQLLLLGEARPDRAGPPGQDGRRPAGGRRRGDPALRRGRAPSPRPGSSATPGIDTHRGLLPALLRRRHPRARDARRAGPRAPRRGGVDQQRGAARVPRVRARRHHARRRRGQAQHPLLRREHRRPPRRRPGTELRRTGGPRERRRRWMGPAGGAKRRMVRRRRSSGSRAAPPGCPASRSRST